MYKFLILTLWLCCHTLLGQKIDGVVINAESKQPVAFVNIGICGKNMGTVSDLNGKFDLNIDSIFDNDTLVFSIVGYNTALFKIADLRKNTASIILLKEKTYELTEVIVKPRIFKQKTLGVTTKSKLIVAGFKENKLGYECGILLNVKKSAYIKKVNLNVAYCTFDSLFYRLNIYKKKGKMDFENILREPIYIKLPKESLRNGIQIDLQSRNIVVDGDFLVTIEHIKDLGKGYLYFCAGLGNRTFIRKTSHGKWETAAIGISLSVIADVEK